MNVNSNAALGDNQQTVDYAAEETARLEKDYGGFEAVVTEVLDEARGHPKEIEDDETMGKVAATVKRVRDLKGRLEGLRVMEKEPHLRRGNAVQAFFSKWMVKLEKDKKTDANGAADVLQARVNDYVNRKAQEERRKREEAARLAREEEERIAREAQEQERLAREAAEKAARARKPENVEAAQKAAVEAEANAARLREQEELARATRQDAAADANAKTADLVRTRTEEGHTVTAKQEPFVEIADEMKLDAVKLWPFVKSEHKLAALKSWAKITQHKQQMDGAVIEMRDRAVIR